jgi:hypothetical protein
VDDGPPGGAWGRQADAAALVELELEESDELDDEDALLESLELAAVLLDEDEPRLSVR